MIPSAFLREIATNPPLTWEQVVAAWCAREDDGTWDAFIKENGYEDWRDFRCGPRGTLNKYGLGPLLKGEWKRYLVVNPSELVPQMLAGPFKGWAIHNPKLDENGAGVREALSFGTIIQAGKISNNDRVRKIIRQLQTQETDLEPRLVIVLLAPDGRILALDGLHTLSAYALANYEGTPLQVPLHLHGVEVSADQMDYFDRLAKGEISILN